MTSRLRPRSASVASLACGVLLLGGLVSGCGGGDDSSAEPSETTSTASTGSSAAGADDGETGGAGDTSGVEQDADTAKFCSAYADIVKSGSDDLAVQKDAIAELEAIGTPASMGADAREGYQLLVDAIQTAKTPEELSSLGEKLSAADTDKLLQFSQFLTTTCAEQLGVGGQ